jgi:hypothetical protein
MRHHSSATSRERRGIEQISWGSDVEWYPSEGSCRSLEVDQVACNRKAICAPQSELPPKGFIRIKLNPTQLVAER